MHFLSNPAFTCRVATVWRIEDIVVATAAGPRALNVADHALTVLDV